MEVIGTLQKLKSNLDKNNVNMKNKIFVPRPRRKMVDVAQLIYPNEP